MMKLFIAILLISTTTALQFDEICDRCVKMVQKLRSIPNEHWAQSYVQHICFESYIRCSHGNKFCSLYFLTPNVVYRLQQEIASGARDAQVCDRVLEICKIN
ncbi:unnamed protein product, partial [Mesorhabditis belari]|uniref:Saposin B-type domain-containing protein n=1 Tax=Mesorhabditis belari TaxID=2138241 RepID=A0AAF3FEA7_9BILA